MLAVISTPKKMSTNSSPSDSGDFEGGNVAGGEAAALTEWAPQLKGIGSVCTIGSMAIGDTSPHRRH